MRRTAPANLQGAVRRIKAWIKAARHLPKRDFFESLKKKLIGHYNYYYVRGNSRAVGLFYRKVIRYTQKWLNRRSQRKSCNWEKFIQTLTQNRVPRPRPTERKRLHQVALR